MSDLTARQAAALRDICLKLISTWVETNMADLPPKAFAQLAASLPADEQAALKTALQDSPARLPEKVRAPRYSSAAEAAPGAGRRYAEGRHRA